MFRTALLLVCALTLSACDVVSTIREGFAEAKAVESDLEQSTGTKPQVGFNWHNGRLTSVTVQFPRVYDAKPLAELSAIVRDAVTREFKQAPDAMLLSFRLGK
ncbi:hypothetical protein JQ596_13510 [Bradyrhizobium manausense]|uniref:hypothetical protein n=1 Tax=Bradyrhizobium TaxID=374 RepID=UPI001BA50B8E|nr:MULTISPECIES: hypothetical protein [Bradyrhizobium]MBR0826560.1 hypothetical protein [Bradyrhizobium manausense]UVO28951.1 hypothetical protein KUF59_42145 [Bradyrhizobium arachidis]